MSRTTRRRRLLTTGIVGGVLLAVAVPMAASAHVTVTPGEATAGSYTVLEFAFGHGCEGSATTSLTIDLPEGLESVTPQLEPGWSVEAVGADTGIASQVIYTADEPVEDGFRSTVTIQVKLPEDSAGETLAFPVLQNCVEGETNWAELAEDGQDPHDLDAPAPLVVVSAATDEHGGHGDDEAATDESTGSDASADGATTTSAPTEADPVARWLAAGGLVAGIAALAVVLLRGRTRKS